MCLIATLASSLASACGGSQHPATSAQPDGGADAPGMTDGDHEAGANATDGAADAASDAAAPDVAGDAAPDVAPDVAPSDGPGALDAPPEAGNPPDVAGASGGTVTDGQMVTLEIPPGALAGDTHFAFTPQELTGVPAGITPIAGTGARVTWTGAGFTPNAEIAVSIQQVVPAMHGLAAGPTTDPPPGVIVFECPNGTFIYYSETQPAGTVAQMSGKWRIGHLGVNPCGGGGSGPAGSVGMELGVIVPSTSTYPIITQNPASVTVNVPARATFNAAASGTAPLTYDWLRYDASGTTDTGASSFSYSIAATTPMDSGALFSYVASNSYGMAISRRALLTANGCGTGPCQCGPTQLACATTCADPKTDRNNCGACGVVCPWACAGGACVAPGSIALGNEHTCVRDPSGEAYCWGLNDDQLGIIDGYLQNISQPARLEGISNIVQVAAGFEHTCVLLRSGQVYCLGRNGYGELGDGTRTDRFVPTLVPGLGGVVQIGAGAELTCALLGTGEVACWGFLGYSPPGPTFYSPVTMTGLTDAVQISVGSDWACAVRQTGEVDCWGANDQCQLGSGLGGINEEQHDDPRAVIGLTDAVQVDGACARRATGDVVCWGGMVDNGSFKMCAPPAPVPGLAGAVDILSTGAYAVDLTTNMGSVRCGLLATGELLCMGDGHYGMVGDGTTTMTTTPVSILTDVAEIGHGGYSGHVCARRKSGQLVCWGYNQYGELGNGESYNTAGAAFYRNTPQNVLPP
jgi:hypothetical protein